MALVSFVGADRASDNFHPLVRHRWQAISRIYVIRNPDKLAGTTLRGL
jgi:hypothetical protein